MRVQTMAKTLVLAEKPSVGRELARVLGCRQGGNGYLSGGQYIVTWALGHLVELAEPEAYGEQYKTWSMDTLPMLPEKMELKVIPETSKQYSVVKKLLHSPEVGSLVIATDAGREENWSHAGSWKKQASISQSNACGSLPKRIAPSARGLQT